MLLFVANYTKYRQKLNCITDSRMPYTYVDFFSQEFFPFLPAHHLSFFPSSSTNGGLDTSLSASVMVSLVLSMSSPMVSLV